MKSLRLIQLQRSVEAAPLPAALAGALLLALLLQTALPIAAELPAVAAGAPAGMRRAEMLLPPVVDRPGILLRDMFAPSRAGTNSVSGGEAASLLGVARSRTGAVAIFGGPGGAVTLRIGQTIGGSRLIAVGRDWATLSGPSGTRILRVGQNAARPVAPAPSADTLE